jgi:hypothetical protein
MQVNIGVGIGAWAIGGIPGIVIGVSYLGLDKIGAFDRPFIPYNSTPPYYAVPDHTYVAPKPSIHP